MHSSFQKEPLDKHTYKEVHGSPLVKEARWSDEQREVLSRGKVTVLFVRTEEWEQGTWCCVLLEDASYLPISSATKAMLLLI